MWIRWFNIFRINKYSIHFCITSLLNSSYYYALFHLLYLRNTKTINFEYLLVNLSVNWISFSKCLDVLPAFICARAINNLWNMCLGVNIFNLFPMFRLLEIFHFWNHQFSTFIKRIRTFISIFFCLYLLLLLV